MNLCDLSGPFHEQCVKGGLYAPGRLNGASGRQLKKQIAELAIEHGINVKTAIYHLFNKIDSPLKCSCGTLLKAYSVRKIQKNCSPKCAGSNLETLSKRENTNLKKYGSGSPAGSAVVQELIKKSNLQKYGVPSTLMLPIVKEKIARTNLQKYGNTNPAKSPQIIDQIKQTHANRTPVQRLAEQISRRNTNLQRYGYEYPQQMKSARDKSSAINRASFVENGLPEVFQRLQEEYEVLPMFLASSWSGTDTRYQWVHAKCGKEFLAAGNVSRGIRCPYCKTKSRVQTTVESFCEDPFEPENRSVLAPYEIDVFVKSKNVGIEVNGIFWHHDRRPNLPLVKKTELAEARGIKLLHFWDFEVSNKPKIVKQIIESKTGHSTRYFARKMTIRKILTPEARKFFNENHLSGFAQASTTYGMFNGDLLCSALSVSKPRFSKEYDLEIVRFASAGCTVVGGLSKFLAQIKRDFGDVSIMTFADRRISCGAAYKAVGFELIAKTAPNYFYFKGGLILSRYAAQKKKLKTLLPNFDEALSEYQNMINHGFLRCFDSGSLKFALPRT